MSGYREGEPDSYHCNGQSGPRDIRWRCNACFARQYGHEELALELLGFWKKFASFEISRFIETYLGGWNTVDTIERVTECSRAGRKISWEQIVRSDSIGRHSVRAVPNGKEIIEMEVERRQYYHDIFKRWFDSVESDAIDDWVWRKSRAHCWINHYATYGKSIEQLETYTRKLESNPDILVKYAMEGYPSRI